MIKQLRTTFETFPDRQTGKNTIYTMTDTGLSAFLDFTPVLVKPGSDKVISSAPEFVCPQDGHEK